MSTVAVPASVTTLKNGDVSVVMHIPSIEAAAVFKGLHPLLHSEVHVDIYDMGER